MNHQRKPEAHRGRGAKRKLSAALVATLLLTGLLAAGPAANASDDRFAACQQHGPLEASELPERVPPDRCDLRGRIIRDHGVGAKVPPPGKGVHSIGHLVDGSHQTFGITTEQDGTVVLEDVGDEAASESDGTAMAASAEGAQEAIGDQLDEPGTGVRAPGSAEDVLDSSGGYLEPVEGGGASPPECFDDAYNPHGWKWYKRINWYIRGSTIPGGLSWSAPGDLQRGHDNWEDSRNICGWDDEIDVWNTYRGFKDEPTRIVYPHDCAGGDGWNMVDFGNMDYWNYIAWTCVYYITTGYGPAEVTEGDIKFSRHISWFTGDVPPGCDGSYSLEAVMTHEVGHLIGLDHVSGHAHLTMYPGTRPCDRRLATLGWGDVKLARILY